VTALPTVLPITVPATDGVPLVGELWLPAGASVGTPASGLVMSHGFSATRAMALPRFAEAFARAGIAVCLYDHRNLGDSGGEPRQHIDPWRQTLDMATVVGWLADRPEVDPERLGVWGSSFSGGEVIALAATDRRLKAVVANAPFAGLGDLGPDDDEAAEARFTAMAEVLTGVRALPETNDIGPMPVVLEPGDEGAAFLPQPESTEWFLTHGPGSGWENRFILSMSADPPFDPYVCVRHVAPAALLMVVASHDVVASTEVALAAFARALEPKQLELVEGHHFVDYQGEGFDHVVGVMTDFLLAHL
jgi:fermentation-respiration switch protein FrsA (DUF1100 family)